MIGPSRSARFRRVMESMPIRDESGSQIPMKFSDSQEILWKPIRPLLDLGEKLWFIVLKARKTYATTFFENLVFVRSTERSNTMSLIVAHDLDTSGEIFKIAKRFYDNLPLPKLKPSRVKEIEFSFPDGSSLLKVVSAGHMGKGRGMTPSCIHASEVAFWPDSDVMIGLFNSIPNLPDTVWIMESTANGMTGTGRAFYEEWKAAIDGRSGLTPIFIPWFAMPKYRLPDALPEGQFDDEETALMEQFHDKGLDGYGLAWRRYTISTQLQGSTDMFRQEYPSSPEEAFITTGWPAFEAKAILYQQRNICNPDSIGFMENGKFQSNKRGWLRIWREPQDGHQYVIGVDTSEGLKDGDYACAQIVDMGTMEQVAIIHGHVQPWDLAEQLVQLGKWYNNAMLAVETQGSGRAVQDYLIRRFNYPHLHLTRSQANQIRPTAATQYGWETNVATRPLLIEAGRRALNTGLVTIHDASTLEEISKFSRSDTGKYQAETGHDDRVLALLIALRSREENYTDAKGIVLAPEYSLSPRSLPGGIRVIHAAEGTFHMQRKIHQALSTTANKRVKNWLAL